jgi:hypothetical protein
VSWTREKTLFVLNALGVSQNQLKTITEHRQQAMVSCPLHGIDKTPSFSVNAEVGVYKCFSCGAGGHLGKLYKTTTGHTVEEDMGSDVKFFKSPLAKTKVSLSYDVPPVVDFCFEGETVPVEESSTAKEYLNKRGASIEPFIKMKAFYCVSGGTKFGTSFLSFRDRLCIPIYEYYNGKRILLSIEGRACNVKEGVKKVIYPKGSSVNTLYDLTNLKINEPLYVVEGLMDLAALREDKRLFNSTAVFGAAITLRQIYLLEAFDVCYIQDIDEAGAKTVESLTKKMSRPFRCLSESQITRAKELKIKDMGDVLKSGLSIKELADRSWFDIGNFRKIEPHAFINSFKRR